MRVIKDYDKLEETIKQQIKLAYPYGFTSRLITFTNRDNRKVKGLRFETDDKIYLIRMSTVQARQIVADDDDFDDDGNLKSEIKELYTDKYMDIDLEAIE